MEENYRPISILPPFSKLLEKIMYEQIDEHMNEYLSPYLCGLWDNTTLFDVDDRNVEKGTG